MIETGRIDLDDSYVAEHPEASVGPHLMLSVSDTGVGMDADTQRHLFEPFFTTKPEGLGTGLGLATVYGIVKASGGSISVYSEFGRGSTFRVFMPRVARPSEVATPKPAATSPAGGDETVLVVEDEDTVRHLVSALLRRQGYRVMQANGPEEGEAIAAADPDQKIDLLVTDVVMPGGNGADLARRVREMRPGIPVLYMSGYTEDAIVHHGVLDPGVAFIAKPFSPEAFVARVRETIDAKAGGEE